MKKFCRFSLSFLFCLLVVIGSTSLLMVGVSAESDPFIPFYYPGDFWSKLTAEQQQFFSENWCSSYENSMFNNVVLIFNTDNNNIYSYAQSDYYTTVNGTTVIMSGTEDRPVTVRVLQGTSWVPLNGVGSFSFSTVPEVGNRITGYMKVKGELVYSADNFPTCIAPTPTPTPTPTLTPTPGEPVNLFPSNDLDLAASSCLVSLSNVSGDFTLYSGIAAVSNADQMYKNPPVGTDSFTVQLRHSSSGWQASLPAGYSLYVDGQSFAGGGLPSSTWRSTPAGFPASSSETWRVRVDAPTANADGTYTGYVRLFGPASVSFSDQVTYYPVCQRIDDQFSLYGDNSDLEQVIKDEHEQDREQSQQQHEEIMDTNDNGGFSQEGNEIFTEANEKFTSIFYPIQWTIDSLNSLANVSPKSSFTLPGIFTDETWEFNVGIVEEKLPQLMTMIRSVVLVFVASVLIYGLYNTITGGKE